MVVGRPEVLLPRELDASARRGGARSLSIRPAEIHKTHSQNVWIAEPVEESAFSLSTSFAIPVGARKLRFVDLVEVQRQAGILQAHRQLGVPEDAVFTLDQIALKLVTTASELDASRDSGRVRAQIVAATPRGRARALSQHFALEGPLGLIAVGTARASLIPRSVYERVRARARIAVPETTRLAPPAYDYEEPLRIDDTDPLLSDHPSDHLTAIQTLADVERAALMGIAGGSIRAMKLTFHRYAELEPRPTLRVDLSVSGKFVAEVVQQGVRRARVTGTLTSPERN